MKILKLAIMFVLLPCIVFGQNITISWEDSSQALSYNIYQDGILLCSSYYPLAREINCQTEIDGNTIFMLEGVYEEQELPYYNEPSATLGYYLIQEEILIKNVKVVDKRVGQIKIKNSALTPFIGEKVKIVVYPISD